VEKFVLIGVSETIKLDKWLQLRFRCGVSKQMDHLSLLLSEFASIHQWLGYWYLV
jgi:hypothetical protein